MKTTNKLTATQTAALGRNYYRTLARLSFREGWGGVGDHDYSGRIAAPAARGWEERRILPLGSGDRAESDGYEVEVPASFGVRRRWQ